ncbi:NAD/NADP-dependent octopine/nopaline dehydrogenase family protein [Siccirubricoccus phaeus]|uniref:NAD/NADP-dependent octopine/nopaline dehydrogenase family protein n=1 Tax=Siccirubricoccus phaeus TaxID=2595053 RepID=UPI0011F1C78B|nr:NAD/NADP octopine/nopaline dehydrogenase family protein [Siccirubricoccus phaeus]
MPVRCVAVLGAGHGGCAAAADLMLRGFRVRLHARSTARLAPLRARGGIEAHGVQAGFVTPEAMTTDLAEAISGADLIMLVVPSVAHSHYARALAPLLDGSVPVMLNPGHTGGGLHFLNELRLAGYRGKLALCETVSLTYISRMEGPAKVGIYSYARKLRFAALPATRTAELFALVQPLYPDIQAASSALESALGNVNAVFHPPGMLMNAGWIEATGGDFLFYREGITPAVARVTAAIDAERMAVAAALQVPAISFLQTFYEFGATTAEAYASGDIARACRESAPNATIKSPASLDDRYIHEDVGTGLVPMAALGQVAGVKTPTMDALIHLASLSLDVDFLSAGLTLEKLGIAGMTPQALRHLVEEGA